MFSNLYFKTSTEGNRLLVLPLERPYIIPDAATERRLSEKLDWFPWIVAVMAIAVVTIALAFGVKVSGPFDDPVNFGLLALALIVVIIFCNWMLVKLWLQRDLEGLTRADRADRVSFHASMPMIQIVGSLVGCVVLAIGSLVYILNGGSILLGSIVCVIFAGAVARWIYILRYKA